MTDTLTDHASDWPAMRAGMGRSATVLPFARPVRAFNRFSMRDRMEALQWAETARSHGYTRLVFDTACESSGHEPGDFIMIYERDGVWASWGIGCGTEDLTLWRPSNGQTIGTFPTMRTALAAILEFAARG
jgi:hypothetical protein